jgi:hypothetical protein
VGERVRWADLISYKRMSPTLHFYRCKKTRSIAKKYVDRLHRNALRVTRSMTLAMAPQARVAVFFPLRRFPQCSLHGAPG